MPKPRGTTKERQDRAQPAREAAQNGRGFAPDVASSGRKEAFLAQERALAAQRERMRNARAQPKHCGAAGERDRLEAEAARLAAERQQAEADAARLARNVSGRRGSRARRG